MKKVLFITLTTSLILGSGILLGRYVIPKECNRKHQNLIDDGRIVIVPVGEVEGRKKFDVIISDENVMDSMYPEEIASSLIHGDWIYDETLHLENN